MLKNLFTSAAFVLLASAAAAQAPTTDELKGAHEACQAHHAWGPHHPSSFADGWEKCADIEQAYRNSANVKAAAEKQQLDKMNALVGRIAK